MWILSMRSIDGEPQEFEIKTKTIPLGRMSDNDIVISDSSASRYHAEILFKADDGTLQLHDLGSTNGTFVNRVRIEDSCRLEHNDVIRIGEYTLNVRRQGTNDQMA